MEEWTCVSPFPLRNVAVHDWVQQFSPILSGAGDLQIFSEVSMWDPLWSLSLLNALHFHGALECSEGKYLARMSGPVLTQDSRAGQPVLKQHLQMFGNIWGTWCQRLRTRQLFVDPVLPKVNPTPLSLLIADT